MRSTNTPYTIEPLFKSTAINQPIEVFCGDIILIQNQRNIKVPSATISWDWLPYPAFRFSGEPEEIIETDPVELTIPSSRVSCKALVTSFKTGSNDPYYCMGIITEPVYFGILKDAQKVLCSIPNFHDYFGEMIRERDSELHRRGRWTLQSSEWKVTIDQNKNYSQLSKSLKAESGFALTHTCEIERIDGKPIPLTQAKETLSSLGYFLSFVRGLWCFPILSTGYNQGEILWQEWASLRITSWRGVRSWFPEQEFESLTAISHAFEKFLEKWQDPLWKEALQTAIHWYVEANLSAGGIEGSIVLSQNALELLGWVFYVEDPATATISSNQYDKLGAAEKIRNLLIEFKIPVDVPSTLPDLATASTTHNATDGPDIFVKLRNGVVHPKRTKRQFVTQISRNARREAWQLGLWYLELCLLKILDFHGVYYQRFLSGYPQEVKANTPWP